MKNPQAFPNSYFSNVYGMTLRDYFAGQALKGLFGNIEYCVAIENKDNIENILAFQCYSMADAMLKERSKPNENPS